MSEVECCFRRLQAALADEVDRAERLCEAGTSACLRVRDTTEAFTIFLDGGVPEVELGCHPAEIELEMSREAFAALGVGKLVLQSEIIRGEVTYRGPVRKLLGVSAVMLSLLDETESRGMLVGSQPRENAHSFVEERPGEFWAIECRGVHKRLGGRPILRGLDLGIPEGMITAILGPSGTGKSVLLKHLVGLLLPDSGEVLVRGESLNRMSTTRLLALRRTCGILFQDGALWGSMNLFDNVALPLRQHTDLSEHEIGEVVMAHLDQVGLAEAVTRMPGELSGGMRKRAGFARALVLDPEIVLFDEPDSGLDPVRTSLLCGLFRQIHSELGGTYVVVTHDIRSARQIADYIVVIWQGAVVASGRAEDVLGSDDAFVRQFLTGSAEGPLGME